jgi:5-methylcytosine-specific restriction enzyme A
MARTEFPRKVRAEAFARAGGCCEVCGARLKVGEGEVDHIIPDQFGGSATIDNARVLCVPCHRAKTAVDIRDIRKSDRVRDKFSGAFKPRGRSMPGSRASGWKRTIDGRTVRRDEDR